MQLGGTQARSIPIACRFVSTDQWLTTHVTTTWTVGEVKSWLLTKFLPSSFTSVPYIPRARPSRKRRPMSPIRFAARQQTQFKSKRTAEEYYQEDDYDQDEDDLEEDFLEAQKFVAPRQSASLTHLIPKQSVSSELSSQGREPNCVDPASYSLVSFSTGQLLEDRCALDLYSIQPYELLELHNQPFIVRLPREVPGQYIEPYYEARVRALKCVGKATEEPDPSIQRMDPEGRVSHQEPSGEPSTARRDRSHRKRRSKLEWHERWVLIHQGLFHLCRGRSGYKSSHTSSLSSLLAVMGREQLQNIERTSSSKPASLSQLQFSSSPSLTTPDTEQTESSEAKSNWVVCLKFHTKDKHIRNAKPKPSLPEVGWWRRGSRDANSGWSDPPAEGWGNSRQGGPEDEPLDDAKEKDKEDSVIWIMLDMLNEDAFENILRLLHREAPPLTSSTFLSDINLDDEDDIPPSPILFAPRYSRRRSTSESPPPPESSPPRSLRPEPDPPSKPVPYPAWRINLLNRARRAGLGDVGKAMECMLFDWHNDEDESTVEPGTFTRGRQPGKTKYVSEREHKNVKYQQGVVLDDDSSGSSEESASEQEWLGWLTEANRRRKAEMERAHEGDSGIQWETTWNSRNNLAPQGDSGSHTQESGASSPRTDLLNLDGVDSMLAADTSPHLATYSPSSPQGIPRIRPRSPLSVELDDDVHIEYEEEEGAPNNYVSYNSNFTYPESHTLRTQQSEPVLAHSKPFIHPPPQRMPMPISMAMTQITSSTVSVGPAARAESSRKGRRRSTLMPVKMPGTSNTEKSSSRNATVKDEKLKAQSTSFGNLLRPKLRLPAPFASGGTPYSRVTPVSPKSSESYDSLKFATPPGSDD
ncbi:unnamed protein product [Somion occarium]|uniref:Uncharacterized protein n=1 Tax=Somion occarium TaxID=3059160 RepID=A0ABP1DH31_9APHY